MSIAPSVWPQLLWILLISPFTHTWYVLARCCIYTVSFFTCFMGDLRKKPCESLSVTCKSVLDNMCYSSALLSSDIMASFKLYEIQEKTQNCIIVNCINVYTSHEAKGIL